MSGQIQTLATPPPVSVQTLLYNIYLAASTGGSGGASWGSITGTLSAQTDLQSALDAKLNLAGGTMTGALVNSTNGASSTPSFRLTGTVFTGGTGTTTKPLALIEPTGTTSTGWSTSGTLLGVNAPSSFGSAGRLADFQVNGSTRAYIDGLGNGFVAPSFSSVGGMTLNPGLGGGGAYLTLDASVNGRSIRAYMAQFYTTQGYQYLLANNWGDAADVGLARSSTGVARISNGSTGRGTLDAAGYQVGGVAGAAGGTFTAITSITVVNGIITAISGT